MTGKNQESSNNKFEELPEAASSEAEERYDLQLAADEFDEVLNEESLDDEDAEPNEEELSREEQDLEELVKDEPLDVASNPGLIIELSDDPVRLYLKEIGGIDLLDPDHEFWLATRLIAARRIDSLIRQHPIAR